MARNASITLKKGSNTVSQTTDRGFMITMLGVLGAIVLFIFVSIIAANLIAPDSDETSAAVVERQRARIAPVGQVRTELAEADTAAAAPATQTAAAEKGGEQLVNEACAACHASGVAGAPIIGDNAEWAKRAEAGVDAMLSSVIDGKGAMPPRGGSALSDEELRRAVEYLLQ